MGAFYRPTWVEISLDALRHNIQALRNRIPSDMKTMAVVKANAYGHGALEIAQEALDCGVDYLGVAFLDEAIQLRNAGIASPILILGYTPPEGIPIARQYDVTLTIYSDELLDALCASSSSDLTPLKVHVKIDTGMGRLGLHTEEDAIAFIERASHIPGVEVEGIFTHYACADEADTTYTYKQYEKFKRIVDYFKNRNVTFSYIHAGNSATAIEFPELSFNMVRLGISMYGFYPSEEVDRDKVQLQPLLSFKTSVVMVKTLPEGSGVSYGATYQTQGEEQIATLPVGYADGFTRMLSGRGNAIIQGHKVPIVGRICMDQCMINITGITNVQQNDEVILIGQTGSTVIHADDLARALGTINYEITCMISSRVPRMYYRNGQKVKTVNGLRCE